MAYEQYQGLPELNGERTYNQKVYKNPDGSKKFRIHAGHIHYKEGFQFKDIDPRLTFDGVGKKWKHGKSSYSCEIPEYADEEIDFRTKFEGANFNVKFKADAGHIQGTYYENSKGYYVEYPNAFGTDIDFRIYSTRTGIIKEVIARSKPSMQAIQQFDYEILLQNDEDIGVTGEANWDKNSVRNFKGKRMEIKASNGKKIFFKPAFLQDSNNPPHMEAIDIELRKAGQSLKIRKKVTSLSIPVDDLVFPVYVRF